MSGWLSDQDDEILELENTVANTKNIALTINGELDLHKRLLVRIYCGEDLPFL